MNTKFYMIIENLLDSFEMVKRILKDYENIYMRARVLQVLLSRKRRTSNEESLGEEIRKQAKR